MVVGRIDNWLRTEIRCQHVIIWPKAPQVPCSKMLHLIELYAERVMPQFDASSALATGACGV